MLNYDEMSIMIPEPLAFPRAAYADALGTHAALLERYRDDLLTQAREEGAPDEPFCFISDAAGLIVPREKGVDVTIVPRAHAVERMRKYHGVCRALFLHRGALDFPVVVVARGVISLHTFAIEDPDGTPRLALVSRDEVVEPRKQEHREHGPWTITRWVAHDREARYAWRPTPAEPASREETVARVMALRGAFLRERIAAFLQEGNRPDETFAHFSSSTHAGDRVLVLDRRAYKPLTLFYPGIRAVLDEPGDPRKVPVVLDTRRWGALFWIDPDGPRHAPEPALFEDKWRTWASPRRTPPPFDDFDEPPEGPAEALPEAPPAAPPPAPEKKPKRPPVDLFEFLESDRDRGGGRPARHAARRRGRIARWRGWGSTRRRSARWGRGSGSRWCWRCSTRRTRRPRPRRRESPPKAGDDAPSRSRFHIKLRALEPMGWRGHPGQQTVRTGVVVAEPVGAPPPAGQLGVPESVTVASAAWAFDAVSHAPSVVRVTTWLWHRVSP